MSAGVGQGLVEGLDQLRTFTVGLRTRFRGVESRSGVLLRGPAGWGEFSPFPEYGPAYASRWLEAAIDAARTPFPEPVRTRVPVNATIPALGPEDAFALASSLGASTAKVKVAEHGQDLADDVERVAAVREALGPDGRIRVDANAAWDVETAVLAIARLARAAGGLEYVEQPCRTLEELREVRRRVGVALAADESVRTAHDPVRIAGLDAADVVVIKVQPLGGVTRALEVVEAAGLPAVVSSALETSVGLAAGIALAAALPELPYACGLGTAALLREDVTDRPLHAEGGYVDVRRVAPDAALLDQLSAPPEQTADLFERVALAAAHLEGR